MLLIIIQKLIYSNIFFAVVSSIIFYTSIDLKFLYSNAFEGVGMGSVSENMSMLWNVRLMDSSVVKVAQVSKLKNKVITLLLL